MFSLDFLGFRSLQTQQLKKFKNICEHIYKDLKIHDNDDKK